MHAIIIGAGIVLGLAALTEGENNYVIVGALSVIALASLGLMFQS